jgi:PLP dependent protein
MDNVDWKQQLRENVARVRQIIAAACERSQRDPTDVHLIAVTKYVSPEVLAEVLQAGVTDLGESQVQQLVGRARTCGQARFDWPGPADAALGQPRWHMIGHLQRNKVKLLLPNARIVHSLDSLHLAETLAQHARRIDTAVDVFIEVNVAGETTKAGASPGAVGALADAVCASGNLRLRGLMTLAPYDPDAQAARPHFARLRELLERLRTAGTVGPACVHLSMGMSQDYAVAVEEGATFVRVGSALFEGLPSGDPRGV